MKKYLPFIPIILVAAGLRIYNVESKNLWFDEVYSWKISQGSIKQIIIETSGDIHPPLYYLVLKYWNMLSGDSVFSMRMLSVLIGILSMIYLFRLSLLFTESRFQQILILLMYAFSPLNIYYSQEVRMLNLNLLLCLAGVYYFYSFLKKYSFRNSFLYVLFTLLSLYTHYFGFLILFTEVLVMFIRFFQSRQRDLLKRYLICFSVINLLYVPWYRVFLEQVTKGQPWRKQQTLKETSEAVITFFREIFLSPYVAFEPMTAYYISTAAAIFVAVLMIYFVFRIFNQKNAGESNRDTIILFFLVPLLIAWLISFNQSILLSRYLSIIVPYLILSIVIFSFRDFKQRIATVIVIGLLAVSIYGTKIYFGNNFKNNDYRKIISYLEKNIRQGDEIIAEPHYMGWSLDYYISHSNTTLPHPRVFGWNLQMQTDSLFSSKDISNLWVILDYLSLDKAGYDSIQMTMKDKGYIVEESKTFYLMPDKVKVYCFRKYE